MKIRLMPDGMFYDFDNGLTLSIQYGVLSYCDVQTETENDVSYRVLNKVDIAVLKTETNEMVPIHRYTSEYQAVSYFPVDSLPEAVLLVQQGKLNELGDMIHTIWHGGETPYMFSKEEADDAIARG